MNTTISVQRESAISFENLYSAVVSAVSGLLAILGMPFEYLSLYYSNVLERQITLRQTLCLVLAQIMFVVMIISFSGSLSFCALCVTAFAASLLLCKKVL